MKTIKCASLKEELNCISSEILKKMDEIKMTQETKPVPHVHQDNIVEWAADPRAAWQHSFFKDKWEDIEKGTVPAWNENINYRRKPQWFDMEQDWIARGKPPVEVFEHGKWHLCIDIHWFDYCEYRFKPTPHPDADVLLALAEDENIVVEVEISNGVWARALKNSQRLRIKP